MDHDSVAARFIVEALREPFVLVDVGCSGGIMPSWRVFGDKLQAYGFDPDVCEIERLSQAETCPGVRYIPAFVAAPADHPSRAMQPGLPFYRRDPSDRLAWWRTRLLREAAHEGTPAPPLAAAFVVPQVAIEQNPLSRSYSGEAALAGPPDHDLLALTTRNKWTGPPVADRTKPVVLPRFLAEQGVDSVDFIKIDCDGPDFEILTSLEDVLGRTQVLALGLEVNFIGGEASNQHTFHNTDRFMRRRGFDLADLSIQRYASSALPFLYADPHPHATRNLGGRPYQADALYARDFGWIDTHLAATAYGEDKLLKLAVVMVLFGRVDQAAELLIMFRGRLEARLDIDKALDLLAQDVCTLQAPLFGDGERPAGYDQYMAAFEADMPEAYGGLRRRAAFVEDMQARAAALEAQLAESARDRDQARRELEAVRHSSSWRLTAPLRALRRRMRP